MPTKKQLEYRLGEVVAAASQAASACQAAADALRREAESLSPFANGRRLRLHSEADRLEETGRTLAREADRPLPSSRYLRAVATVGVVTGLSALQGLGQAVGTDLLNRFPSAAVLVPAAIEDCRRLEQAVHEQVVLAVRRAGGEIEPIQGPTSLPFVVGQSRSAFIEVDRSSSGLVVSGTVHLGHGSDATNGASGLMEPEIWVYFVPNRPGPDVPETSEGVRIPPGTSVEIPVDSYVWVHRAGEPNVEFGFFIVELSPGSDSS